MEKRFKAAFQSLMGIVHFLAILFRARYSNLSIESSLGKRTSILGHFANPDLIIGLAQQVKELRSTTEQQQKQIEATWEPTG